MRRLRSISSLYYLQRLKAPLAPNSGGKNLKVLSLGDERGQNLWSIQLKIAVINRVELSTRSK
jgi:hypothetical protein